MSDQDTAGSQTNGRPTDPNSWTFDVQRGLAWTVMLMFAFVTMVMSARVAVSADISDINDTLKSALAVLFNIVMLVLGYFFGSSKSSQTKDDTQSRIVEKLIPPTPPASPISPAPMTADQIGRATLKNGELAYFTTLPDEDAKAKFLAMTPEERIVAIGKATPIP